MMMMMLLVVVVVVVVVRDQDTMRCFDAYPRCPVISM